MKKLYEYVHATKRGSAIMTMTAGVKVKIDEGKVYFGYFEEYIDPKDFGYEIDQTTRDSVIFFPGS